METLQSEITFGQLLEMAIHKEIESQRLYASLEKLVDEPSIKDAFAELTEQELGHQTLLEQYYRGELSEGAFNNGDPIDYKIFEQLGATQVVTHMELKDTFLFAARREKLSHEFYSSLASIHPDGEAKKLLNKLARQELKHKQRVEFLYTEVGFPQTDGG